MKKRSMTALVIVATLGLGLAGAGAASAATGTITCTGTRAAALNINAKGPGSGTWVNAINAGQSTPFSFPGGYTLKHASYQSVNWSATASAGFYSTPAGTCAA